MDFRVNFRQTLSNLSQSAQNQGQWIYQHGSELRIRCVTQIPSFLKSWKIATVVFSCLALAVYYFIQKGRPDKGGPKPIDKRPENPVPAKPDQKDDIRENKGNAKKNLVSCPPMTPTPESILEETPVEVTDKYDQILESTPVTTSDSIVTPSTQVDRVAAPCLALAAYNLAQKKSSGKGNPKLSGKRTENQVPPAITSLQPQTTNLSQVSIAAYRPITPSELSPPPQPQVITLNKIDEDNLFGSAVFVSEPTSSSKTESAGWLGWVTSFFEKHFTGSFSKVKLNIYPHMKNQLLNQVGLPPQASANSTVDETQAWNTLLETLKETPLSEARTQYRNFVKALRTACTVFANKNLKSDAQARWIFSLAYHRFTSIKLFAYSESLMLYLTGAEAYPDLSLATFDKMIEEFNEALKNMPQNEKVPKLQSNAKKVKGHAGIRFNPLGEENKPYVDGELSWDGCTVKVLRHGVPLTHDNTKKLQGQKTIEIDADYRAFLKYAEFVKNEKILSVILEDSDEKSMLEGDESERVKARLSIAKEHPNFIPMALRLDGKFFNPDSFTSTDFDAVRRALWAQILDAKSGYDILHVKEQLTESVLTDLLKEVQAIYFPNTQKIATLDDYHAFIMLSYAHITLYLCQELKVSILEAICKDDIDRGNAFKTVLKLHFLYLTGQLDAQHLKKVLVNTLVAPVLVKKQKLRDDRYVLISRPCKIMQQAFSITYNKLSGLVKKLVINQGSYKVFDTPSQSITPRCSEAPTRASYTDYLQYHLQDQFKLSSDNWIEKSAENPKLLDRQSKLHPTLIRDQIDREKSKMEIEQDSPTMFKYLAAQNIKPQESLKIMSAISTQPVQKTTELLQQQFDNPQLNIKLTPDLQAATRFELQASNGVATLKWITFFNIMSDNKPFAKIKAEICIADHRNGQGIIALKKL